MVAPPSQLLSPSTSPTIASSTKAKAINGIDSTGKKGRRRKLPKAGTAVDGGQAAGAASPPSGADGMEVDGGGNNGTERDEVRGEGKARSLELSMGSTRSLGKEGRCFVDTAVCLLSTPLTNNFLKAVHLAHVWEEVAHAELQRHERPFDHVLPTPTTCYHLHTKHRCCGCSRHLRALPRSLRGGGRYLPP